MTKEQLLDNATFIELFSISNEIERTKKIIELSDKAKEYKCSREFNRMLKVYEKELADKVSFDNEIVIKDIPLSGLSCSSFICNAKGIFKKGEKICYTPVIICEILTNKETKNEKVKLAVYNIKTKKWEDFVVDNKCLTSNSRILKLNEYKVGIDTENARDMVKYFRELKQENINIIPTGECFSSLGWDGDNFAPYNNLNILDNIDNFIQIYNAVSEKGNYEVWYETIIKARKNKYVKLAMATTFASPLLEKINIMPYIVNLWSSRSGTGKTVASMIAISSWGDPSNKGLQFSSDSTKNYYMKMASFLKNITMFCDEFQKVKSSNNLDELVMILANGKDKGRLNIDRKAEEENSWSNNFLFTNNEKLAKESFQEQVLNRIVDIECNETMIGIGEGNKIVKVIKENYGFAGKIYIEYITKIGFKAINDRVQEYIKKLINNYYATEKQAACIATILVANELSQECLFKDEEKLTIEDIKDSINNKEENKTWRKAYQFIINDFAENIGCFEEFYKGTVWGKKDKKDNNYIYIVNKNILEKELKKGQFEFDSIKKDWDKRGIIQKNSENKFTWNTTVNGTRGRYVVINVKNEFLNEL